MSRKTTSFATSQSTLTGQPRISAQRALFLELRDGTRVGYTNQPRSIGGQQAYLLNEARVPVSRSAVHALKYLGMLAHNPDKKEYSLLKEYRKCETIEEARSLSYEINNQPLNRLIIAAGKYAMEGKATDYQPSFSEIITQIKILTGELFPPDPIVYKDSTIIGLKNKRE